MPPARRLSVAGLIAAAAMVFATATVSTAQATASPPLVTDPASLVNPLIGTGSGSTGGSGNTNPGPDMPFGMIQWGPDTSPTRTNGGGYRYDSNQLGGFSLDRLSGAGCPIYGDVPILPMVGAVPSDPTAQAVNFSHSDETAQTGYYKVTTTTPGSSDPVTTQLTTAMHSGIATFTFPATTASDLLLKVADSEEKMVTVNGKPQPKYQKVFGTSTRVVGSNEVVGSVTAGTFCNIGADHHPNYTLHFDIVFDQPFTASGTWPGGPNGDPGGVHLTFDTTHNQTVTAKVGISYTSAADAALNLSTEIPGWDFGGVRDANVQAWNKALGRIQIAGGTADQQTTFYTALYHALIAPHVYSDVNGQYTGMDGKIHTMPTGRAQYADYSGWDIYRDEVQLLALIAPDETSDIIQSMLNDYAQDGMLPKWAQGNSETYEMVGDPADPIIADAYAFGVRGFDAHQALAAMVAEATQPNKIRPAQSVLDQYGYLPIDADYSQYSSCCHFYGPVSTQLEYETADYAIAALAKALGQPSIYTRFMTRAQDWQNTFNPASGYVQPRLTDGQWAPGFAPGTSKGMVEGTAAQYSPMVPFNIAGLMAASGGAGTWEAHLDSLVSDMAQPGLTNAALSNEPSLVIPWEFDYLGKPWKTQQAVRQAQTELFTDSPAGEPGNDDLGAMSSWYAWSALGLYPATPGTNTLVTGSPVFPQAVVHLANGHDITVDAPNAAPASPYVQSLSLNGSSWPKAYLTGNQYLHGTALSFGLGTSPDPSWGSGPAAAPPSDSTGEASALPYLPDDSVTVPSAGGSTTVALGVQNVSGRPITATVTASVPAGTPVAVSPAQSALRLAAGARGQETLTVQLLPNATSGQSYRVPITVSSGDQAPARTVVLTVTAP